MIMKQFFQMLVIAVLLPFYHAKAQSPVLAHSKRMEVSAKSYLAFSGGVDSVVVIGSNFRLVWSEEPIMEEEDCHLIGDLVGTCAILDPPIISRIEVLDSNVALLFGGNRNDVIEDRQLIFLDIQTGHVLGWYGYMTWKGLESCKLVIDLESRTFLIGAKENEMLEDAFYIVDREAMTMQSLTAEGSMVKSLEISLLSNHSPTTMRKGYFMIHF